MNRLANRSTACDRSRSENGGSDVGDGGLKGRVDDTVAAVAVVVVRGAIKWFVMPPR